MKNHWFVYFGLIKTVEWYIVRNGMWVGRLEQLDSFYVYLVKVDGWLYWIYDLLRLIMGIRDDYIGSIIMLNYMYTIIYVYVDVYVCKLDWKPLKRGVLVIELMVAQMTLGVVRMIVPREFEIYICMYVNEMVWGWLVVDVHNRTHMDIQPWAEPHGCKGCQLTPQVFGRNFFIYKWKWM